MRRARTATFVLLAAAFGIVVACTDAISPLGKGDDFVNDTDGEDQATPDQGDATVDDVFARVDSGYGPPPDGYAPVDWCGQCACPSGSYCFGGATGYTTFSGTCADAAPDTGAGLAIGCLPLPAACDTDANCDCIIESVQAKVGCSPVCSITKNLVYCPNP